MTPAKLRQGRRTRQDRVSPGEIGRSRRRTRSRAVGCRGARGPSLRRGQRRCASAGDAQSDGDLVSVDGDLRDPSGVAGYLFQCGAERGGSVWRSDGADQLVGLDVPVGQGLAGRLDRLLVKS